MPRCPTKRATNHAIKKANNGAAVPREITVDDVIGALLDLFAKLEIDAPHLVSRVKALDRSEVAPHRLSPHFAAIGELLSAWHQEPDYLDKSGNPRPLKIRGARRSFASLARNAVPNMDTGRLLSELERVGAITIDTDQFIHVHMRSLPVYEDKRLAIEHTLTSLDSFIRTLRHNLDSDPSNSDQLFHRIAWNDDFDGRLIPTLKIKVRRQGQNFLESFDNWMTRKANAQRRESRPRSKPFQISIGVYLAVGRQ
jgi:hypothetical protein